MCVVVVGIKRNEKIIYERGVIEGSNELGQFLISPAELFFERRFADSIKKSGIDCK